MRSFIYVLRTRDVDATVSELRNRGRRLTPEKHGEGPAHFSFEHAGALFEIYPANDARPCARCAGCVEKGRPATVCRACFDALLSGVPAAPSP